MEPVIQPKTLSIVHPLDQFYARSGVALPPLSRLDPEEVPEPYKTLLVHENDMTSTLEAFHGRTIHLSVLGREERGEDYYREVVLKLDKTEKPVEFGAIRIHLGLFQPDVRAEILAENWPLGRILNDGRITYLSRPKAFLRMASDNLINKVLNLSGAHVLYGRCNSLLDAAERPLADIVEILPPQKGA